MTSIDPQRVSARVSYDASGRSFQMDNAVQIDVEIDTCSWAPIGGTTVNLYAADAVRSVQMVFGVDAFLAIFEESMTRFAQLDIEFTSGENAEQDLDVRNRFLRHAAQHNPAILAEASRVFHRLGSKFDEASARLASIGITMK